jgi:hypothetical protein
VQSRFSSFVSFDLDLLLGQSFCFLTDPKGRSTWSEASRVFDRPEGAIKLGAKLQGFFVT